MKKLITLIATLACLAATAFGQAVDNGDMIINFTDGTQKTYLVDNVVSIVFNRNARWTVTIPDQYKGNEVYLVMKNASGDKKYKMERIGTTADYTIERKAGVGDEYTYAIKQKASSEMCGIIGTFRVNSTYVMVDDISDLRLDCEKASFTVTIPDDLDGIVYLSLKTDTGTVDVRMTKVAASQHHVDQKADVNDEYSYYIRTIGNNECVFSSIFYVNDTYIMIDDVSDETPECHASISEKELIMNVGQIHQLFMYKDGETLPATWTSADPDIADVKDLGYVYAIREGTTVITGEYNGDKVYCTVTCSYISSDYRLNGSQYFLLQLGTETTKYLVERIICDYRPNGEYTQSGTIVPKNADCLVQVWNSENDIAKRTIKGENSFKIKEDKAWFNTALKDPIPEGGWDNICGGQIILNTRGRFPEYKKLTSDHVLLVSMKGNYSEEKKFEFGMKINGEEYWFMTVNRPTGINEDGDWETFEITVPEIEAFTGFNFAEDDLDEDLENFAFLFKAWGAGATVDMDAVFFYIPAAE